MKKINVLVTLPYSLFPANNGGRLHVLSTLKPVAEKVNLHLLAYLSPSDNQQFFNNRETLLKQYYTIFQSVNFLAKPLLPFELAGKRRKLFHFLLHTLYQLPLMDVSFYSPDFVRKARQLIKQYNIDLVEAHQLHVAFLKRFLPHIPVILIEQNREHELWPFWPHPGKKPGDLLWNQFGKLSRKFSYEVEVENKWKLDARCFISLDEMKKARMVAGKIFWMPPAVEESMSTRNYDNQIRPVKVLWVGGFDWFPNAEGAVWFAKECWPHLKIYADRLEFHFIGTNPPADLLALHDNRTFFVHGFVADITSFWQDADLFIVPLRSGGGIRIKIVEALNAGIPVISTSKGCEGIPYEPNLDLIIADDPLEFSQSIMRLASESEFRKFLGTNGKDLIRRFFTLQAMGDRKMNVYYAVMEKRGT